jgi:hypothetical protein
MKVQFWTTYCLALLMSSISKHILGNVLVLSDGCKSTKHPYVFVNTWSGTSMIFTQPSSTAIPVQLSMSCLWNVPRRKKGYRNLSDSANDMNFTPRRHSTREDPCNFILVAALLIKRSSPAH